MGTRPKGLCPEQPGGNLLLSPPGYSVILYQLEAISIEQ